MIVPVASSGESGLLNQLPVNAYGAFIVTKVSDTQYNAKLLYDYIIPGPGISFLHGSHHCAQKFNTTTEPR